MPGMRAHTNNIVGDKKALLLLGTASIKTAP